MMEFLKNNWIELLSALGLGTGGGMVTRRVQSQMTQRKLLEAIKTISRLKVLVSSNAKEIDELKKAMIKMDQTTRSLETMINSNSLLDSQLRQDLLETKQHINKQLERLEKGQDKLLNFLMDFIQQNKS